jgi:protein XagA
VFKRCVALACGLLFVPSVAWSAAWTLPDGTGQWLTTLTAASSTSYLNGSAGLSPTPRYDKDELTAWGEYGVTDRFTAIFAPGLQHIGIAPPIDADRTGLGYTEFGGRYALLENKDQTWVLSGQATLRIPGTTDTSNPAAIGYTDVESDLRVLLGHSFMIANRPAFYDLEAAERVRTAGLPSEFRFDATFGVWVVPRWMIMAQSFNVVSEGAGNTDYTGGSYDYEKLQLSAVYKINHDWSVQGGGYVTYAGRNSLQENGLVFGVWRQF